MLKNNSIEQKSNTEHSYLKPVNWKKHVNNSFVKRMSWIAAT
jgi:hypothetical protein